LARRGELAWAVSGRLWGGGEAARVVRRVERAASAFCRMGMGRCMTCSLDVAYG
jgi:hypothetical protein